MRTCVLFFMILCSWSSLHPMVRAGVQVDVSDDDEEVLIWTGPGWYYGIWFDNEWRYNEWQHSHRHGGHNGHRHGGHKGKNGHGKHNGKNDHGDGKRH